jgi:hypothetical protein
VLWRRIEGEVIVLDLVGSTYLTLNDTGACLWELLTGSSVSESELVDSIVGEFAVDRAGAERDTAAFLRNLESRGLLATSD